jgi:hypothetical protein
MTAKTIRVLRATVAAAALVLLSATPAGAQYAGSDIPPQPVVMGNLAVPKASSSIPVMITQRTLVIKLVTNPFGFIDVYIQSDPVFLGQFQADANGNVNATVTIPEAIEPGSHTLVAKGTNQLGKRIELRQPIQLRADPSSADPAQLSLTGSNARGIAAVGGVLFVVGAAATVATRRRLSDPSFGESADA